MTLDQALVILEELWDENPDSRILSLITFLNEEIDMAYKVIPRYGSMKPGAKPQAWAVVDSDGIEVKRELYKENAQKEAQRLNRERKQRHMTKI